MAWSKLVLFCVIVLVSYVRAAQETTGNSVEDFPDIDWKIKLIIRQKDVAADAIKKLSVKTPAERVRMANMISMYLLDMNYALFALNTVLPNLVDTEGYGVLVLEVAQLNVIIATLQQAVNDAGEIAKIKLVLSLTSSRLLLAAASKFIKVANDFAHLQFGYTLNFFLYAVYRLEQQAIEFKETNKHIGSKIPQAFSKLNETIGSFMSTDKRAINELRHMCVLYQTQNERIANRMENWIELNPEDTNGIKIAKDVLKALADSYPKVIHAATELFTIPELKAELGVVYEACFTAALKIGDIEYRENRGGEEYLRSSLIDALTSVEILAENLKDMPYQ